MPDLTAALATNPALPAELVDRLLHVPAAEAAAANPALPVAEMRARLESAGL
ncbi:hypothetical protein [Streptomyces sp. TLI_171]|uniref:hypothetical protein n=1 Tax=Streptomyces sp. TLI_171 TaxID=1938859 RepID=UPI0015D528FD|nr:hypothetical protein [Streptomyces sp. TLI_171]